MFGYPLVTDLYGRSVQRPLLAQFDDPGLREAYARDLVAHGAALTKIRIPAIGVDVVMVEGTSPEALRAGAGHYPETPLPGQAGNGAIAGHRTTYGQPLNRLDEVAPGELIELEPPGQVLTYQVLPHGPDVTGCASGACWITAASDWSVVEPFRTDAPMLTLTTCHPKGSDRRRLILWAALVAVAARPPGGRREPGARRAGAGRRPARRRRRPRPCR